MFKQMLYQENSVNDFKRPPNLGVDRLHMRSRIRLPKELVVRTVLSVA